MQQADWRLLLLLTTSWLWVSSVLALVPSRNPTMSRWSAKPIRDVGEGPLHRPKGVLLSQKSDPLPTHVPIYFKRTLVSYMSTDDNLSKDSAITTATGRLPFWLDPGTKGGVLALTLALFLVPIFVYNVATSVFGIDEIKAGIIIGMGFTIIASLAWVSTYLFRVATKDMTYAKQLKDYEDAVIKKRLEELDDDELQALQEEIDRDKF